MELILVRVALIDRKQRAEKNPGEYLPAIFLQLNQKRTSQRVCTVKPFQSTFDDTSLIQERPFL